MSSPGVKLHRADPHRGCSWDFLVGGGGGIPPGSPNPDPISDPIPDQNGQSVNPFSDPKGPKTIPFGMPILMDH